MECVHRGRQVAKYRRCCGKEAGGQFLCGLHQVCTLEDDRFIIQDGTGRPMANCETCQDFKEPPQLVSAICLAYDLPRRQNVLEEAVESFLRQTYPLKELVIVVDTPGLVINCDQPGVRVVTVPPCSTLGEKYNAGVTAASGSLICSWDDDDISLPWRMSLSVELLGRAEYFNPKAYWFLQDDCIPIHEVKTGYAHNASMFRKSAWAKVGGYEHLPDNSQDAKFDAAMHEQCQWIHGAGGIEQTAYIYRWQSSVTHGSATQEKVVGSVGEFTLKPHWDTDYTKLTLAHRPPAISVWLTNRDTLQVRKMVDRLLYCEGVGPITIVDCASTYQPLLDWYGPSVRTKDHATSDYTGPTCPVFVIRAENHGPMAPWMFLDQSKPYIVSDGDLDLDDVPLDFVSKLRAGLDKFPNAIKVGLSLRIDDLPASEPQTERVLAIESKFWQTPLDADHFDAAIDTTLAMYRARTGWGGYAPAIRLNAPYSARHVAWYLTEATLTPDWKHYLDNLNPRGVVYSPALAREFRRTPAELTAAFRRACETPSDINQHCETLKSLASQCKTVVEFGTRGGVSTTSLLAGQPERLVTIDINQCEVTCPTGVTAMEVRRASSLETEPIPCDLLFIDSLHTRAQLAAELDRHAGACSRWIAMHDTATFGNRGEDGGDGLQAAIDGFMVAHPEWFVMSRTDANNGLTVLSRHEADRPCSGPKLTIGMASYRDAGRTTMTIMSLLLSHPDVSRDEIEIVVVDNDLQGEPDNPDKPDNHSRTLKLFAGQNGTVYDHYTAVQGTAAAKGRIFEIARGRTVLVIDCHIILPTGALRKLIDWSDANPCSKDLLQGPLIGDGLGNAGDHFEQNWGSWMLGQWATKDSPEPFEVEAHACGLFACNKAAWPGFHPLLRGFGPEEGHLHNRIRRNGGKCWSVPWLRWWHGFSNPGGSRPTGLAPADRLRGYIIDFLDTGSPSLVDLRKHYIDEMESMTHQQFDAVLAKTRDEFGDKTIRGLGDRIERVFEATGIARVAKAVLGDDCGCPQNREFINRIVG